MQIKKPSSAFIGVSFPKHSKALKLRVEQAAKLQHMSTAAFIRSVIVNHFSDADAKSASAKG